MIYKLATAALSDAAAQLDVRADGTIYAVWWNLGADLDADGENVAAEVSFISSATFASNDTTGTISSCQIRNGLLTSGAVMSNFNGGVSGLQIPVAAGERLYLHTTGSGPATCEARVFLYVEDKGGGDRPASRRR